MTDQQSPTDEATADPLPEGVPGGTPHSDTEGPAGPEVDPQDANPQDANPQDADPQDAAPEGGTDLQGDAEAEPGEPMPAGEAAKVVAERDDYLNQLLRARADYDNLNKRRLREVAEARDRGAASVVERLLEVLDNFGFALQAAAVSDDQQLAKGVQLVHSQLVASLNDAGLEEVAGVGSTFDPTHHEALMNEEDGVDRAEPEIAEVLRTGYRFKTQLLRPASVKVVS